MSVRNDILLHKEGLENGTRNAILKSFVDTDIEKAVAAIGETRQWADGLYRKVADGKWVRVVENKEKTIATTTMKKIVESEINKLNSVFENKKEDFRKNLTTKYTKNSLQYQTFFDNAWSKELESNPFLIKINQQRQDLRDEQRQIYATIAQEAKQRREKKAGKSELDVIDIKDSLSSAQRFIQEVKKDYPMYVTAKEAMPVVTADDYYLDTETTFANEFSNVEYSVEELDEIWNKMKADKNYKHHQSPKSSSEYLINKTTGDIYRYSDHWGSRIASCSWYLGKYGIGSEILSIGRSNLKNFSRKDDNHNYFNPKYQEAMLGQAKLSFRMLNNLAKENPKFYLTKKAQKEVKDVADRIYKQCVLSLNLSALELKKLRRKYTAIFE